MLVGGTGKYELVSKEVSLDPKEWYKFSEVSSRCCCEVGTPWELKMVVCIVMISSLMRNFTHAPYASGLEADACTSLHTVHCFGHAEICLLTSHWCVLSVMQPWPAGRGGNGPYKWSKPIPYLENENNGYTYTQTEDMQRSREQTA